MQIHITCNSTGTGIGKYNFVGCVSNLVFLFFRVKNTPGHAGWDEEVTDILSLSVPGRNRKHNSIVVLGCWPPLLHLSLHQSLAFCSIYLLIVPALMPKLLLAGSRSFVMCLLKREISYW